MNKAFCLLLALVFPFAAMAHPMPNSVLSLDIKSKDIACALKIPVSQLQFALPFDISTNTEQSVSLKEKALSSYLISHFAVTGEDGYSWRVRYLNMKVNENEQEATGKYQELTANFLIIPPAGADLRNFTIYYDAVVHQVVNHKILVVINEDWENGKVGKNEVAVGAIAVDIASGKVLPFSINLANGSYWKGFWSMVNLGANHIADGTDHLLFLLVLLLSAPLISTGGRWTYSGSTRYTLARILKIVTAFTIGHSITLIIGALGLVNPNTKPIEILIALSILFTAVHAIRPIFEKKEIYVAMGFGLVHGLAFASTLSELHLDSDKLVLSLLGFNIGIELMQLFVILIVMPWLILLSPYKPYRWIRIGGATFAGIAAIGWAFERYTGDNNFISVHLVNAKTAALIVIFGLACFSSVYIMTRKKETITIE